MHDFIRRSVSRDFLTAVYTRRIFLHPHPPTHGILSGKEGTVEAMSALSWISPTGS